MLFISIRTQNKLTIISKLLRILMEGLSFQIWKRVNHDRIQIVMDKMEDFPYLEHCISYRKIS